MTPMPDGTEKSQVVRLSARAILEFVHGNEGPIMAELAGKLPAVARRMALIAAAKGVFRRELDAAEACERPEPSIDAEVERVFEEDVREKKKTIKARKRKARFPWREKESEVKRD